MAVSALRKSKQISQPRTEVDGLPELPRPVSVPPEAIVPGRDEDGWPLMLEDDLIEALDMGEANYHYVENGIAYYGVKAHLADRPGLHVFANLNVYYHPKNPKWYVSPDVMAVEADLDPKGIVKSYRIPDDGPPPMMALETMSESSGLERDLEEKAEIYALMKVSEYILVDPFARYLYRHVLLKRFQPNGRFSDEWDDDGGVTSRLGFRVVMEEDGQIRVLDARSGRRYPRPYEAVELEARVRQLEAELARRGQEPKRRKPGKKK